MIANSRRLWLMSTLAVASLLAVALLTGVYMRLFDWVFRKQHWSAAQQFDRGLNAMNLGRYDEAVAEFTKALRLDAKNIDAYGNRSFAYAQLGQYNNAIADCNAALDLDPHNAGAYGNRGVAYAGKGDFARAIADYDRALQLDPNLLPAYGGRGSAHGASGHHDEAIADFTKALELNPTLVEAYYNRGVGYAYTARYDKAIDDFHETFRLEPSHAGARTQLTQTVAAKELDLLIKLSAETASKEDSEQAPAKEVMLECTNATGNARSYSSRLLIKYKSAKDVSEETTAIDQTLRYVRPDRYHVFQKAGTDYDEWITIGSDHYRSVGLWFKVPDPNASYPEDFKVNSFLLVDKFLRVLRAAEAPTFSQWRYRDRPYSLFECSHIPDAATEEFGSLGKLLSQPLQLSLWVDSRAHFLAKADITGKRQLPDGQDVHVHVEQAFTSYDEGTSIEPPAVQIRPRQN